MIHFIIMLPNRPRFTIISALILFMVLCNHSSFGQDNSQLHQEFTIDFKNPVSVVNAIFYAAKTKDTNILWVLQDPGMQADKAIYDICTLVNKKEMKNFCDSFKEGEIVGEVQYINNFAKLRITGVNKDVTDYTVTLAKRYGNWFLMTME